MVARLLALLLLLGGAAPFEQVTVPSPDRDATGQPVQLPAFLFRPQGDQPRPAVVQLHGCGGVTRPGGTMVARDIDYAGRLVAAGYVVLAIDSFAPRGVRNMCSPATFQLPVLQARPRDAYGALVFLQSQPFVRPDRIALLGWSEGGGTTLMTVRTKDSPRPDTLPHGDFRAAVAFYPGSCSQRQLKPGWATAVPLLVLMGQADVWTPYEPCKALIETAAAQGSPVRIHGYPGAYHDFDWPGIRLHEEPGYMTSAGVVPLLGTDPEARQDAIDRTLAFLHQWLD